MANSNFIVRGGADFSAIHRETARVQTGLGGLQTFFSRGFKFAGIALGVRELIRFGKEAIGVASDLTEVQNVVDVTFGHMAKDINEFASVAIKQFGLSELSAKKFSSTMGAMLKSSGVSGTIAKDMSIELTKLSADMASFYNLENDVAFEKIMSGMSGMTQPLKELGINMNIANLEYFALTQGIKKSWQEMNQAEQTMLRYNYLLSVTGDAQGDFARNSGSWANQVKILKEQWKEFMGLIGKALIEILLPIVKVLNSILEAAIGITKEIGKMYTMLTGKEVTVTAQTAAEAEMDLADGIDKATKAAKKALAPFDELNILQSKMGDGDGLTGIIPGGKGETNTSISTKAIDSGFDETKSKLENFFVWFGDKWNGLKQTLSIPIFIPEPIFASIPSPIYNPDWGLQPPAIREPIFSPLPSPVYQPDWGLEIPTIPQIVFPALGLTNYLLSLGLLKVSTILANGEVLANTVSTWGLIHDTVTNKLNEMKENTSKSYDSLKAKAWEWLQTDANNFLTHKANLLGITAATGAGIVSNLASSFKTSAGNAISFIITTQNNLQTFGKNATNIAGQMAVGFANNLTEGFKTGHSNFVNFANSFGKGMVDFGKGVLDTAADTARGFVSTLVSGFKSVWESFKSLMSAMGEKTSGWFSENKGAIKTAAIVAGAVTVGVGLAFAAPAIAPYAAAALGGLASIPALATGGITNGEMVALIGDNPGGREVVSPLNELLGMIRTEVSSAVGNNQGNGDLYLTFKIGEDTITEKVISNINRQNRISGKTVIQV